MVCCLKIGLPIYCGIALLICASWLTSAGAQDIRVSPHDDPIVDAARKRAYDALREHRYDEAIQAFGEAVEAAKEFVPTANDYFGRVDELRFEEDYVEALRVAEYAAEVEPENPRVYYVIGLVYSELEYYDDALDAYEQAIRLDNTHVDSFVGSWSVFETTGESQAAVEFYKTLREETPESELLFHYLGMAYHENANHEDAVLAFRRAVELNPENWTNNRNLRLALYRSSEFSLGLADDELISEFDTTRQIDDSAVETYRTIVENVPNAVLPKMFFARALVDAGTGHDALPLIEELLRYPGIELDVRRNVAQMFVEIAEQSDEEQQIALFREAAVQYQRVQQSLGVGIETQLEAQFEYGKALIGMRRFPDAIESLEQTLDYWVQVHPTRPAEVYFQLGLAHLGNESFTEASIYFRMVELSYGGSTFETLGHIATIHYRTNEFADAIPVLKQLIDEANRQGTRHRALSAEKIADYRVMLADCLINTAEYQSARDELSRLENVDTHQSQMKLLMAQALLGDNKIQLAIDQLNELEQTDDWNAQGMTVMGEALIAQGEYRDAIKYLEQAEHESGTVDDNKLLQAECQLALGNRDRAREIYDEIIDRDPSIVEAWIGLGDMEIDAAGRTRGKRRIEHLSAAIDLFEKGQVQAPTDRRVRTRLHDASDEKIEAESSLQASQDQARNIFYAFLVMVGATIPLAAMAIGWRRQTARRMFKDVLNLERDIRGLIRHQITTNWGGDWDRLRTEEGFSGRIPYRQLEKRMANDKASDILEVSNFGHLVAIVDVGWVNLGFDHLAKKNTKQIVVAAMSYVGTCRNAIAHAHEIQHSITGEAAGRGNPLRHMNRQVRQSLNTIRSNLDFPSGGAADPIATGPPPTPPPPPPPPVVEAVRVRDP